MAYSDATEIGDAFIMTESCCNSFVVAQVGRPILLQNSTARDDDGRCNSLESYIVVGHQYLTLAAML